MSVSTSLFEKINNLASVYKILDWIGIFFADYLIYIALAVILIVLFLKRYRLMAIAIVISVFISRIIITEPLKMIFHRARPYVVLENVRKLVVENTDYASFPSGHAAIFFAIAAAIFFFNRKLGIFTFIVAILVGLSRIYVGVHWPIDIVAGAIIGIVSGIITYKLIIVPLIRNLSVRK
jgi:undecaprenyl-diphosphatase